MMTPSTKTNLSVINIIIIFIICVGFGEMVKTSGPPNENLSFSSSFFFRSTWKIGLTWCCSKFEIFRATFVNDLCNYFHSCFVFPEIDIFSYWIYEQNEWKRWKRTQIEIGHFFLFDRRPTIDAIDEWPTCDYFNNFALKILYLSLTKTYLKWLLRLKISPNDVYLPNVMLNSVQST